MHENIKLSMTNHGDAGRTCDALDIIAMYAIINELIAESGTFSYFHCAFPCPSWQVYGDTRERATADYYSTFVFMNQVEDTQKDRLMKTLAVLGFIAIIVLAVWLAVRIVGLMPQAFTSLASIADSVYNPPTIPELMIETENSSITSGEDFTIAWNEVSRSGSYVFSYQCEDGVALTVTENTGSAVQLGCNESLTLGDDLTEATVAIDSERSRVTDVTYTLAFVPQGAVEPLTTSENTVTVKNNNIPEDGLVAGESTDTEAEEETEVAVTPTPGLGIEIVDPEPEVSTPLPPAPTVIETVVLQTPESDPNGQADLAVQLLAVGELTAAGDFVQRANLDQNDRGAFQFEVRNVGTKTSTDWDFVAQLTSGAEYNAPLQTPLQPQERVVFTLGYDNVGDDGINLIGATVRGGDDANGNNNSFTWAVNIVE